MAPDARSSCTAKWFGAEGEIGSKPILIRGRRFLIGQLPSQNLSYLLVVVYHYRVEHTTGLPTASQYEDIGRFESEALDGLEAEGIGLLVLVETNNGIIRYYCYVKEVEAAVELVNRRSGKDLWLDLEANHDPSWTEYTKRVGKLSK